MLDGTHYRFIFKWEYWFWHILDLFLICFFLTIRCQRQGASNLYANLTFLSCRQLNTLKQGVWLLPLNHWRFIPKRFIVVVLKYPPKVVLIASSLFPYRTNPNCWFFFNFIVIKIYIFLVEVLWSGFYTSLQQHVNYAEGFVFCNSQ